MKTAVLPSVQHNRRRGDPGGFSSDGFEIQHGAEPAGTVLTSVSPSHTVSQIKNAPPTPTRKENKTKKNVMSLLLDEPPPPPPPTPPPSKKSKQRAQSSMRARQGPSPKSEPKTVDDLMLKSEKAKDAYIEERLKSARAIYAQPDLCFDEPAGEYRGRPSITPTKQSTTGWSVTPTSAGKSVGTGTPPSTSKIQQIKPVVVSSSFSASSRKTTGKEVKDLFVRTVNSDTAAVSSSRQTLPPTNKRPSTPDARKRKVNVEQEQQPGLENVPNPTLHNRRSKTPKKVHDSPSFSASEEKPKEKKPGFLRKIFGKKKKYGSVDDNTTLSNESHSGQSLTKKSKSNTNLSLNASGSMGASFDFFAHDDVSTLTAPTVHGKRRQDPDPHVIPQAPSDPPLGDKWSKMESLAENVAEERKLPGNTPSEGLPAASPMSAQTNPIQNLSMRDPSPRSFSDDPFGLESTVDDPPLFLKASDDEDEEFEEKKEDDLMVKTSMTSQLDYMYSADSAVPPPPPPPPSSTKSKSSKASMASRSQLDYMYSADSAVPPPPPPPPSSTKSKTSKASQSPVATTPSKHDLIDSDTGLSFNPSVDSQNLSEKSLNVMDAAQINAQHVAFFSEDHGNSEENTQKPKHVETDVKEEKDTVMKLFNAYGSQFKNRQNKINAQKKTVTESQSRSLDISYGSALQRNVEVTPFGVTRGVEILRARREADIKSGVSERVVPTKKKPTVKDMSYMTIDEPEPKDPIQRAGRRLLAKAAVPIQSACRRYLAQCEAVDRMWALMEIQCYFRRWRARAFLLSNTEAAKTIQRAFRLKKRSAAATQIQRIVRGYLASMQTFDTVYMILLLQAKARGNFARDRLRNQQKAASIVQRFYRTIVTRKAFLNKQNAATKIQAEWRSHSCRAHYQAQNAATKIQAEWRSYSCRIQYQFDVVDIIIVQSIARRWMTNKAVHNEIKELKDNSAILIQSAWRGFQGYTDYIFTVIDILVIQRNIRRFLAKKCLGRMKREAFRRKQDDAATVIQSHWRRQVAQTEMLYDLVHIILVQSVARRFLVKKRSEREVEAAIAVQAAWRGFWEYSHYIILQYEATRLQAIVRGNTARRESSLKIGSAIMIQAVARMFLVQNNKLSIRQERLVLSAAMASLRQNNAARKLQFWWRIVLECQQEKNAALKIESFFFKRKGLPSRETRKSPTAKSPKTVHQKIKEIEEKKESGDDILEKVWLNTVDEDHVDVYAFSPQKSSSRLKRTSSRGGNRKSFDFPESDVSQVLQKAESFKIDKALRTARQLRKSDDKPSLSSDKYLKMYGIKSSRSHSDAVPSYRSPSPSSKKNHKIRVKDTYRDFSSIISGEGGFDGEEEV